MIKATRYILIFALAACGTEKLQPEQKENKKTGDSTVNMTETQPDLAIEKRVELRGLKNIPYQQKCDSFITAYLVNYEKLPYSRRTVLMRFENSWMKQVGLVKKFTIVSGDSSVYPRADIGFYEYTDSSQCANAYSNWLACFGSDCNQIVPGAEAQIKSAPGFYIINEKEIITLDYSLAHEKNNWNEMKKNLQVLFANSKSVIVEVNARGKVRWVR